MTHKFGTFVNCQIRNISPSKIFLFKISTLIQLNKKKLLGESIAFFLHSSLNNLPNFQFPAGYVPIFSKLNTKIPQVPIKSLHIPPREHTKKSTIGVITVYSCRPHHKKSPEAVKLSIPTSSDIHHLYRNYIHTVKKKVHWVLCGEVSNIPFSGSAVVAIKAPFVFSYKVHTPVRFVSVLLEFAHVVFSEVFRVVLLFRYQLHRWHDILIPILYDRGYRVCRATPACIHTLSLSWVPL